MNNLEIIQELLNRGFNEVTSQGRRTKARRFKHPAMTHYVSVKLAENQAMPTSRNPVVLHLEDLAKLRSLGGAMADLAEASRPANAGSLQYDSGGGKVPGQALSIPSQTILSHMVTALLGQSHQGGGEQPVRMTKPLGEVVQTSLVLSRATSSADDPALTDLARAHAEVAQDPRCHGIDATTKERLVQARVGQGAYREKLFELWGNRCAASDCTLGEALIASHAKSWAESSNTERLDPFNGLLLAASIDRLFDRGLISFSDEGSLLRKPEVAERDLLAVGLQPKARLHQLQDRHRPYLAAHRAKHGFGR